MNIPVQLKFDLYAVPAGENSLVANKHVVLNPDFNKYGWLPVSSAPTGWVVPVGAKYFYNIDKQPELKKYFPIKNPEAQILVYSYWCTFGVDYVIDDHTIWWMLDDKGKAPWPLDWISPSDPGSYAVYLKLYLVGQDEMIAS